MGSQLTTRDDLGDQILAYLDRVGTATAMEMFDAVAVSGATQSEIRSVLLDLVYENQVAFTMERKLRRANGKV